MPKLKGLAQYAETHDKSYRRIEAVAEIDGNFRVLDLTDDTVRAEILNAESANSCTKVNLRIVIYSYCEITDENWNFTKKFVQNKYC